MLCCGARPPPRHERRNSWNKKVNLPWGRSQKAALGIPACARSTAKLPAQMLAAGQSVMRRVLGVTLVFKKLPVPLVWGPGRLCGGGTPQEPGFLLRSELRQAQPKQCFAPQSTWAVQGSG